MSALGGIFVAIDLRLAAIAGLLEYERMPAGDPSQFPALQLFDNGEEPIDGEPGGTRLGGDFTLEGFVEGGSGAVAHDAALALHAAAVFALCGDGGTLGGIVETIEIVGKRRVDVAELASKRRIAWAQDFAITYSTRRGDPGNFA